MVELLVANEKVAGSNLVSRSNNSKLKGRRNAAFSYLSGFLNQPPYALRASLKAMPQKRRYFVVAISIMLVGAIVQYARWRNMYWSPNQIRDKAFSSAAWKNAARGIGSIDNDRFAMRRDVVKLGDRGVSVEDLVHQLGEPQETIKCKGGDCVGGARGFTLDQDIFDASDSRLGTEVPSRKLLYIIGMIPTSRPPWNFGDYYACYVCFLVNKNNKVFKSFDYMN